MRSSGEETPIQVTIGRIEIRAEHQDQSPRQRAPSGIRLEDYLNRGKKEGAG